MRRSPWSYDNRSSIPEKGVTIGNVWPSHVTFKVDFGDADSKAYLYAYVLEIVMATRMLGDETSS